MSTHPANVRTTFNSRMLLRERWSRLTTRLFVLVFLSGIFEGAARKWLLPTEFPEVSYIAYLSKFIVFWLICFTVPASAPASRSLYEWRKFLLIGLAMLIAGALVSAISGFSVAGGFLTIVMVVAGPVLAYLATPKIRMANLRQVLRWIAVMSLFPAVLGLIQFELPVTHVLNKYVGDSSWTDVITDLGRVRATGTFSFISGMTAITVLSIWSGMSLRALSTNVRDQTLGLVAVVGGFTSGLAALSRSAVFMGLVLVAVRLLFVGRDRSLLILIVVGVLGYGYLSIDRPTSQTELEVTLASGVFIRHSRSDSVLDRFSSWGAQLSDAVDEVPFGNGFGVNQIGGRAVETGRRVLLSYEAELARLVAEVGVLGVLGVLIVRIGLLLVLFRAWQDMVNSPARDALLLSIAALSLFFVSNTAFNHVAAGFVWPIAAIALSWASSEEKAGSLE